MSKNKEWEIEATIQIRTSYFGRTKEEAEKEAYNYLFNLVERREHEIRI